MAKFIEVYSKASIFFQVQLQQKYVSYPPYGFIQVMYYDGVPKGIYVEMNFITSSDPGPTPHHAFMMSNLRLRDGYDQSSNLLGVFCGTYVAGIVQSIGQNM